MLKVNENIFLYYKRLCASYKIVESYLVNSKIKNANLLPGQQDRTPGIVSENREYGNQMIIKGLETRLKELEDSK